MAKPPRPVTKAQLKDETMLRQNGTMLGAVSPMDAAHGAQATADAQYKRSKISVGDVAHSVVQSGRSVLGMTGGTIEKKPTMSPEDTATARGAPNLTPIPSVASAFNRSRDR